MEQNGLRAPPYEFTAVAPEHCSVRISPQLLGLGLLEAISEADIPAHGDPTDIDGAGISGRMRIVKDPESDVSRQGGLGWKANHATVRAQTASALRTDMGVLSTVFPDPDCGSSQTNCGDSGSGTLEAELDDLVLYVALLGVPPKPIL